MPDQRKITVDWTAAALRDKRLHDLRVYWLKLCGDRPMPSRDDVDPLDIPRLLPFLFLIDVLDDPLDFRFRLSGTHFREFAGEEVTGKLIGEVFPPDFCAEVRTHWANSVEQRQPLSGKGQLWVSGRDYVRWEGRLSMMRRTLQTVGAAKCSAAKRTQFSHVTPRQRA